MQGPHHAVVASTWQSLCERLHVPDAVCEEWWGKLHDAYEGPGRHYHTLRHLSELLEHSRHHAATDQDAVELAIFFHDIVYDARGGGGGKNERDSAVVFRSFAEAAPALEAERSDKVAHWIVQTSTHRCGDGDDEDCRLFMDFDMAILASEHDAYMRYAADVRQEYSHLSSFAWCYGRSKFLSGLASGTAPIFATPSFRARGEGAARRNARAEAEALRWQLGGLLVASVATVVVLVGGMVYGLRKGQWIVQKV